MRPLPFAIVCAALTLTVNAEADDLAVYESVDDIVIGRVFLTPAERRWLDANRHATGDESAARGIRPNGDERQDDSRAAGYIIDSSGRSRAWAGDDFVAATERQISALRFPGDVRVIRHAPEPESATPESDDDQ